MESPIRMRWSLFCYFTVRRLIVRVRVWGPALPAAIPSAPGAPDMIVVKVGGGAGIDYDALCDNIAELWREGRRLVLIHGGSHETNLLAGRLGHPPRFVTSPSGFTSRYTDRATLEIFMMIYTGKVNKLIVER